MTAPEWAAVAICIVLLVVTAIGSDRVSKRRKREGR